MNNQTQSSLQQDDSLRLWQLIILHEGTTFKTTGRGSRPGVEFTYEVSRTTTTPTTDSSASTTIQPTDSTPTVMNCNQCERRRRGTGRHYAGQSIEGYGNELWIITLPTGQRKNKSISRSTVDLAYRNALEEQEQSGFVSGPRKLGVPGVRSNLYAMFLQFGVITSAPGDNPASRSDNSTSRPDY